MNEPYKILVEGATAETELKKSRFIANVSVAESKEDAEAFIESIRKKYYDARHNCYAYVIGKDGDVVKYSDDGEPGQTAGLPMYSVIKETGIRNVVVVVTRFFGGTLLGAGPLAGMYREATSLGLKASIVATMKFGIEVNAITDYPEGEKVRRLLEREGVQIADTRYSDKVCFVFRTSVENFDELEAKLISVTASKIEINKVCEAYFQAKED